MLSTASSLAAQRSATVTTIAGDGFAAPLEAATVTDDGVVVRFAGRDPLPLGELESLVFDDATGGPHDGPGRVWLRSGGDYAMTTPGGSDDAITLQIGLGSDLQVPARYVRAIRFEAAAEADGGFSRALADPPRTDDVLFAKGRSNGEITRLSVEFTGFDGDAITVRFRGRDQRLPIERIHGLVFGAERGAAPPPQPRPTVAVQLAGDLALAGRVTGLDARALTLRLPEGVDVAVPLASVARIDVQSDRIAWLSAMAPAAVDQTPAFDRIRPWLVDRAPGGDGLVLDGNAYSRGVCLVPRTSLTWKLDPGTFTRFEAVVGIDDRAGDLGQAVVRVLLDGEVAWERTDLTAASPAESIHVPLGTARQLTLVADFGPGFDLGDHCAFARARLVADD